MNVLSYFAISLFLLQTALLPAADESEPIENTAKDLRVTIERHGNQNYITLRRNQGQSVATKSSYTTLEGVIFTKTDQNLLPFLDVGLHTLDSSDNYAANIGGGLRFLPAGSNRIFGINTYYDYRKDHRASYNQLGIGFEILGDFLNLRFNGYLPVGKKEFRLSRDIFNEYIGDYIIVMDHISISRRGIDFTIEALIADNDWWGAHIALGTYYYHSPSGSCQKNILGSACRLSADFAHYFNFSVLTTYDRVFRTMVQAQLGISIPFSFSYRDEVSFRPQNARVFSRVQRQDLIILNNNLCWFWNY